MSSEIEFTQAVESLTSVFERLRDEAITEFCDWCKSGWSHSRHGVSANSETFREHQLSIIQQLYEARRSEYDLQDLFDACCEVYRYGVVMGGYQSAAAEAVGRITGRMIYEERDISNSIARRVPPGHMPRLISDALREVKPAFVGWNKAFYLLRDVARIRRHFPRAKCATCGKLYDRWREPNTPDWSNEWRDFVIPSRSSKNTPIRKQWSCSWHCFLKAQRELDREIKWLKIAKQRQTEVRRYLRDNRAA